MMTDLDSFIDQRIVQSQVRRHRSLLLSQSTQCNV